MMANTQKTTRRGALVLLGSCAMTILAFGAAGERVKIASGIVEGFVHDGVSTFKGIPFAQPPVGELRWRPPQPVKPWSGMKTTTDYGPDCPQLPFPGDPSPLSREPREDCLVLNVWRPAQRPSAKLPVMVWIYGGANLFGGSSPAIYDGSQFAKRGLVLVSFNYRVNRLGFFAHPALTKEAPAGPLGNYAYMDQIAALKWVQSNIAAFGGDPANVTVFGESAGARSVLVLLTSPLAKGLFHKAVMQSNGAARDGSPARLLKTTSPAGVPSAETSGLEFAKANGISGEDAAALAALRSLSADKIIAGLTMATSNSPTFAGQIVDGSIILEPTVKALKSDHFARVPIMVGATSADMGVSSAKSIAEALAPFGSNADDALDAYDPGKTRNLNQIRRLVAMDRTMIEPARFVARTFAAARIPAYHYRFSYVADSMRKDWADGAPHASEIPFVFDTVKARYGKDLTQSDAAMAELMISYWAAFAKTGDPNGPGRPDWPVCKGACDTILDFTNDGIWVGNDPWKKRLDLTSAAAENK